MNKVTSTNLAHVLLRKPAPLVSGGECLDSLLLRLDILLDFATGAPFRVYFLCGSGDEVIPKQADSAVLFENQEHRLNWSDA